MIRNSVILLRCQGMCENPHCVSRAKSEHHLFKQSTHPEYKDDPDNKIAVCDKCHSEIERRQRTGEPFEALYPIKIYRKMLQKIHNTDIWLILQISISNLGIYYGVDQYNRKVVFINKSGQWQVIISNLLVDFIYSTESLMVVKNIFYERGIEICFH